MYRLLISVHIARRLKTLVAAAALATLAACGDTATPPPLAPAPLAHAERQVARNLFRQGFDLQTAGDYLHALEQFQRSQQIYPAPTTLLHIAECEAGLLRLVEAAASYRALTQQLLPPDSPAAFIAAQTRGAAELQQIELRLPHVGVEAPAPAAAAPVAGVPGACVKDADCKGDRVCENAVCVAPR